MSATLYDIVHRWADITEGKADRPLNDTWNNIKVHGDRIYSWGTHFEMARPLRDRKGNVEAYLLNGDRVSMSTNRHQSEVRSELARRGAKTVIIPYEALDSAGIDRDTVRILEVQEERWETTWHSAEALEEVPEIHREHITQNKVNHEHTPGWRRHLWAHMDYEGRYWWATSRHWLGGSLIRARVTWTETAECPHCHGLPMEGPSSQWTSTMGRTYAEHLPTCGRCRGGGTVTVSKHRWATFLSSFDEQETRPSYFFCELPARSKARTIAEAYEALKPEPVKLAEAMGRAVTRQGDIFAVPTTYTKAQLRKLGAVFERMADERVIFEDGFMRTENRGAAQLLGTNHRATEVARLGDVTLARGVLWHKPEGRDPDHKRQPMGDRKGWHVIVKNTVPVAA